MINLVISNVDIFILSRQLHLNSYWKNYEKVENKFKNNNVGIGKGIIKIWSTLTSFYSTWICPKAKEWVVCIWCFCVACCDQFGITFKFS